MNSASSSYVDQAYFKKYLGKSNDLDDRSIPINMVAVEIGWLLNTPYGFVFLRRL